MHSAGNTVAKEGGANVNVVYRAVLGAAAGAAATAVLNAATYADMAVRGRAPSKIPEEMVAELAKRAGIKRLAKPREELDERSAHRREGLGALLGYADGFGAAAAFGMLRPAARNVSWFWAGIGLAIASMALSEGTAAAMGKTNPAKWALSSWVEDLVPRCLYGWVACATFDRLHFR